MIKLKNVELRSVSEEIMKENEQLKQESKELRKQNQEKEVMKREVNKVVTTQVEVWREEKDKDMIDLKKIKEQQKGKRSREISDHTNTNELEVYS